MARLMLTVGDFQAWVQPVTGSVQAEIAKMVGEEHPLAADDHEVGFYEVSLAPGVPDRTVKIVLSENEALAVLAAWLQVDEGGKIGDAAISKLMQTFGVDKLDDWGWLLP